MIIRPAARDLLLSRLRSDDRILILGATGWFGRTVLLMLEEKPHTSLLPIASVGRRVEFGRNSLEVEEWSGQRVEEFDPTVILNFAFLTREKWEILGDTRYRAANGALTERLLWAAQLPSVRMALTVSSGAAVSTTHDANPYGELKRIEEEQFQALPRSARSLVIARAWSLSGPLVQNPHSYLFSDLILQARTGVIRVSSAFEVWRRYTSVDDYLAVCIAKGCAGWSGTIDSGGKAVEAESLADTVARFAGGAHVVRSAIDPRVPASLYMSDNQSWLQAGHELGFEPAGLPEQVERTALGLKSV
jgi:nucleoside-diphosphate-sugar epimerase